MSGSSMQKRVRQTRKRPISHATARPRANPPPDWTKNCSTASLQLKAPVAAAAIANLNATRPDASLMRLSPLSTVVTRDGALSLEVIALTESAAVGEITAPSANAAEK